MKRFARNRGCGLYRSNDGLFLGVCAGLAERFDWSPWGVRLLFLALQIFLFHFMFLVYIALGLVLRRDPLDRWERCERKLRHWDL
jgi:phage shock protein PspC (stress-responsive transcriptional regulator)